jgi:hypothetical protein
MSVQAEFAWTSVHTCFLCFTGITLNSVLRYYTTGLRMLLVCILCPLQKLHYVNQAVNQCPFTGEAVVLSKANMYGTCGKEN